MNQYKYLIWSGTASLVVLSLFLLTAMDRLSNTATTTNTISFTGEGKIFAIPDVAAVSFSIVTEAVTSKEAQDQNSERSNRVVDFLKDQKIDENDIKTTGYNVYPQYSYPRPLPLGAESISSPEYYPSNPKITGYQVNQSFEVKVHDLEKVSTILDGLVSVGANQVNHLGFKIDDEEKLKEEARKMAIEDAKKKAKKLKKELDIKLGKIVNYSEGGNYPIYLRAAAESFNGGIGGGGIKPSIPVGENEIVVNVTLTYQIR